jgi:ubiquinone/menaquinone biosynthesis C-methylase UbiE
MKKMTDDELIALNQRGYDESSSLFQVTRPVIWPELEYFKQFTESGNKVLDVGCGHGRLVKLFSGPNIDYHGFDHSEKLIKAAQITYPELFFRVGDARALPYADNYFDSVWMIALLHHFSPTACLAALREAHRVIRPLGKIIITVWQPKRSWVKKWFHLGKRSFLKKWGGQSWLYYHYFTPNELKSLVGKAGFMIWEEGFLKRRNRNNYFIVAYRAPIA